MHICGNFHEDSISSFNVKLATDKKTDRRQVSYSRASFVEVITINIPKSNLSN